MPPIILGFFHKFFTSLYCRGMNKCPCWGLMSSLLVWIFIIEQGRVRCGRKKLRLPILSHVSMFPTWCIQFQMHLHDTFFKVEKGVEENCVFSVGFGYIHCLLVVPTHSGAWLIVWNRSTGVIHAEIKDILF